MYEGRVTGLLSVGGDGTLQTQALNLSREEAPQPPPAQSHRVAVKTLRKGATQEDQRGFLKEAQLMSKFHHDHILRLIGVCLDNETDFIVLELMEGGDLASYLR